MFLLLLACTESAAREHVPEEGVQFAQINGLELAYFEEGEGPLVLLLHGFPDTPHTWDLLTPVLVDAGYRVVRPWLRGYAPSAAPSTDDYESQVLGQDVLAWLAYLEPEGAVTVLGHDWGASAAYSAALQDPSAIDALITSSIPHPGYFVPKGMDFWNGRHFVGLSQKRAPQRFVRNDYAGVDKFVSRWSPEWAFGAEDMEASKNAMAAPDGVYNALGYYRAAASGDLAWMHAPVQVPTWTFAGDSDLLPVTTFYGMPEEAFSAGYKVIELEGGHFMHQESPEAFAAAVLEILEQVN